MWLAVGEDALTVLDLQTMSPLVRYSYTEVDIFGGSQDDFMIVLHSRKELLFSLSKPKVIILFIYLNA